MNEEEQKKIRARRIKYNQLKIICEPLYNEIENNWHMETLYISSRHTVSLQYATQPLKRAYANTRSKINYNQGSFLHALLSVYKLCMNNFHAEYGYIFSHLNVDRCQLNRVQLSFNCFFFSFGLCLFFFFLYSCFPRLYHYIKFN